MKELFKVNDIGPDGNKSLQIPGGSPSRQIPEELPKGRTCEFGHSVSSERKEEKITKLDFLVLLYKEEYVAFFIKATILLLIPEFKKNS